MRARLILLVALAWCVARPAWSDELLETAAQLPVTIGKDVVRLDGLIIRKSDAQGRLPIAILTNGGYATATGGGWAGRNCMGELRGRRFAGDHRRDDF